MPSAVSSGGLPFSRAQSKEKATRRRKNQARLAVIPSTEPDEPVSYNPQNMEALWKPGMSQGDKGLKPLA